MSKEKAYEYRKLKINGAIHHMIKYQGETAYKIHSWDGPAIEPIDEDCPLKKAWYINGIEYTHDEYEDRLREREGLPFFKQAGFEEDRH